MKPIKKFRKACEASQRRSFEWDDPCCDVPCEDPIKSVHRIRNMQAWAFLTERDELILTADWQDVAEWLINSHPAGGGWTNCEFYHLRRDVPMGLMMDEEDERVCVVA